MIKSMVTKFIKKKYGIDVKDYRIEHKPDGISITVNVTAPVRYINVKVNVDETSS